MTTSPVSITLSEWETKRPDEGSVLTGRFLDGASQTQQVVELLAKGKLLGLTELRRGLQIEAYSHVGRIRIGNVNITVVPKIKGVCLLNLLRYAYGLRRLKLVSDSLHLVDECGFEDLLIFQLNAEFQELHARGLLRAYLPSHEHLSSPRGRLDISRLALDGGTVTATLPCRYYPKTENTLLNQVLMSGLQLAAKIASIVDLRRESRRLASLLEPRVSLIQLDRTTLDRAVRQMNRLTTAYSSAISIIRLLVESQGIVLEGLTASTALPGFLFDMNAFFQAILSRFLRENLPNYTVLDEYGLKGMMNYNRKFNPQQRRSPTPRPDYVIMQKREISAILDAKYRDLWEKPLPREMLYQLAIYAISQRHRPQSSILYPTTDGRAREARIDLNDPIHGHGLGTVCLRPVHLMNLMELIASSTAKGRRDREAYARALAFG